VQFLDALRRMPKARTGTVAFEHSSPCKDKYHRRCTGRWRCAVTTDSGRRKVSGATKDEVLAKLDALKAELSKGVRPKAGYTVEQCIADYLAQALPGRAAKTVSTYREAITPLIPLIGRKRLTELSRTTCALRWRPSAGHGPAEQCR